MQLYDIISLWNQLQVVCNVKTIVVASANLTIISVAVTMNELLRLSIAFTTLTISVISRQQHVLLDVSNTASTVGKKGSQGKYNFT